MTKFGAIFALILIVLSSCVNKEERARNNLRAAWHEYFEQNFDQTRAVEVYVATNRRPKTDSFTCDDSQFGVNLDRSTRFGVCKISVPKNHIIGEIDVAQNDDSKSVERFKILGGRPQKQNEFIADILKSERSPLVFVHGFNVRHQEAVLRASQIAYDLKYQGPIVLFTWPAGAQDGLVKDKMLNETYANNSATAAASIDSFKNFLELFGQSKVKINLVVHSMGHQVVLPALNKISDEKPQKIINELVLNAPDFDVVQFRNMAANLNKIANRTTLYCSENDKAMIASKTFNKSGDRLGACAFVKEVDVVDVSQTDDPTLGLGHGYYSSRVILGDVTQVLFGIEASKRSFIAKSDPHSSSKYILRK